MQNGEYWFDAMLSNCCKCYHPYIATVNHLNQRVRTILLQKRYSFSDRAYPLSSYMRKPAFCISENKDADLLRGNREAGKRLCFRYIESTIPVLSKSIYFKLLAIFCGCTARFASDLVGTPKDRFSHNEAHIILHYKVLYLI